MKSLLIRNSIHFPIISTLEQIPLIKFLYPYDKLLLYHIPTREHSTPHLIEIPFVFVVCSILFDSSKDLQSIALIPIYYVSKSFNVNMLVQEYKDKTITTRYMRFNVVRLTMPTYTNERKKFHYTIESIIEDKTRYNYWVSKKFHVFPLLVSTP